MKKRLIEKPFVHLALISLLGLFAYSNTFHAPFTFDDDINIVANQLIRDPSNALSFFAGMDVPFASRPLMYATFVANYYFGGLDAPGYHAVNIGIHLINGVLLYWLVIMTGRRLGQSENRVAAVAVMSSALFVLHPVQTQAVTNTVNRSMLLATTFYLSGLALFLKAATSEKRKDLYMAGLAVASFLGMASREDFATFPIMLFFYDLFFISRFKPGGVLRHWKIYLPVVLSLGYTAYLIAGNTYTKTIYPGGIPPVEYALTQFEVHWTYVRLLLFPVNQNLDYDYPVAKTLFEPSALLSVVGYIALWAGAVVIARRKPLASFLAAWFLITLFPVSFGVTFLNLRLDDVLFEHRLYLPSAGFLVAIAAGATMAASRLKGKLRVGASVLLALFPLVLAGGAYARNGTWKDELTFWKDAMEKSPGKARPHNNLGIVYKNRGETEKALEQYEAAIRLDPYYPLAYNNLGNIYLSLGFLDKAIAYYETALSLNPDFADANSNIGLAYYYKGSTDKAIEYYERALALSPYYAEAHLNLGVAYKDKGLTGRAVEHFREASRFRPGYIEAHFNLGLAYLESGAAEAARREFETVIEIDPGNENALLLLRDIGNPPQPGKAQ